MIRTESCGTRYGLLVDELSPSSGRMWKRVDSAGLAKDEELG